MEHTDDCETFECQKIFLCLLICFVSILGYQPLFWNFRYRYANFWGEIRIIIAVVGSEHEHAGRFDFHRRCG